MERKAKAMQHRAPLAVMLVVIGLFTLALVAGCATGDGARLDMSQEVWRMFNDGGVAGGYRYFTTGVENRPDAILALNKEYTLVTERWAERRMNSDILKQLVGLMNNEFSPMGGGLVGSWVLDDEGERIGMWYSPVALTGVKMLGDNNVQVNPPDPLKIKQFAKKGSGR